MKTRLLFNLAALSGAAAILWMGLDFIGSNVLALAVTAVIGGVYALGLVELVQFRAATASLRSALENAGISDVAELDPWLDRIHPTLRQPVAQRIQGERIGLPTPVFSPYLAGLLVMLGLLGTFIGMVDTLQGAVVALEGSTELSAIRAGLAAPIQGLGLAFGTSVAGVAASAMLGLNATLSRRERMQAARLLDTCAGTVFRQHSLQYNRQQTYLAIQGQAEALPQVAGQLTAMAGELERMGQALAGQLLENQEKFHAEAREQYRALGESVGASLQASLAESGRLAGQSIAPVVEQAMAKMAGESRDTNAGVLAANREYLEAVSRRLAQSTDEMTGALRSTGEQLAEGAKAQSRGLLAEIGKLREEASAGLERDKRLLEERQVLMGEMAELTLALREATGSQQAAVSDFVQGSAAMLQSTAGEFREQLSAEAARLTDMTTNVAGSAAELSSLGEAFGLAVQLFSESNEHLVENLSRIEQSMEHSTERSDEQMGYYVAQAREIIDQSMLSQREIIDELQRLGQTGELRAAEAG